MDKIDELLTRGVENIIPNKEELEKVLRSGKKLNVYFGIDPTATHIHVGNATHIRRLATFVELGHHVTFLIGDFTALIGDTSDKDNERPVLTSEQIRENFRDFKKQAEKLLDFSKVDLHFNSEWLSKLNIADVIKISQHFSAGDFVGRELIKKRLADAKKVGLHELLYPVLQGYDSYHLDTDIQIGGTDQTFNMQAGRVLQRDLRNKESFVIAAGFLEGTDGRKMSKSWGNAIWLDDSPDDMFGKVMSIRDELVIRYFTLSTNLPINKVGEFEKRLNDGENPMNLKKELAWQIVSELHSPVLADRAWEQFENTFQKGNTESAEMEEISLKKLRSKSVADALLEAKMVSSKSEAKRLLEQKAIERDGQVLMADDEITSGVYKIGKKKFLKIK